MTTHYLEEAEMLCRNIGIINHGELIENTTMKSLLSKLEAETFILDLSVPVETVALEQVVWRLLDSTTLEIEINKGESLNHVFAQLSEQGINVQSMRNKANRLEELFVTLVAQAKEDKA